uniref:Glycosyltransferase n=1 Tax=Cleretum bellidiforme TaxID=90527 RepID=Q8W237_CLEBE|nr:betanidin 6-O-glucosyltransferase [Cleretum bellidiforme]
MSKIELVLVPTPGMGHLLSAVELSKLIIRRENRISVLILILSFPFDSGLVNAYVDFQSRDPDNSGSLTFITLPPLSNIPDCTSSTFFTTVIELHKPNVKQVVEERVRSGSPKPAGFVIDMLCPAMMDVAEELEVPSYILFTSGANLLNVVFHFLSLADNGVDIATEVNDPDKEVDVPGFRNRVPCKVLPLPFLEKDFLVKRGRRFRRSNGILVNTSNELESYAIQTLLEQAKDNKIPPVYPVGPILELNSKSRCGTKEDEEVSIMRWLDEQPVNSVLFVCFGSMGTFDEDQVKEIANGLEQSGYCFLWSLRQPPPEGKATPSEEAFLDTLPEGFVERTSHKGKIIGWAPQVSILAHKAVGGFVSHCGWNSTLESLWFGVPMATWPISAEQQLNAFELVKEFGMAVEIRMDFWRDCRKNTQSFVVTSEEIENGVKKLMSMDEEMVEKVKKMSDKSRKTLEDGGSSHHSLGRFINDLLENAGF